MNKANARERATPNPDWNVIPASPVVHTDRTATFSFYAPDADHVELIAFGMEPYVNEPQPMEKDQKGLWSVTIGPLPPNEYEYGFSVDGSPRLPDPMNANTVLLQYGSLSRLIVPDDTPAFYEQLPVPHGELHIHYYRSQSLGKPRSFFVYTPPGFDRRSEQKYPVLYLHHGGGQNEGSWAREGRVNFIMDNFYAKNEAVPMIIVMPFGHIDRNRTPIPGADMWIKLITEHMVKYGEDLLNDIIPIVENAYPVLTDQPNRAMAGLSMGGQWTKGIGLKHLELFSHIGIFSSGGRATDLTSEYAHLIQNPTNVNKMLKLFWIGCGEYDGGYENSRKFTEFLTAHGINHIFYTSQGAHVWLTWQLYLYQFAPLLFRA